MGYLRVSTGAQELDKNKADILRLANQEDLGRVQFVEEKVSGKVPWRKRRIADLLETLRAKDNLVVSELSRLGRSMLECMEILHRRPKGHPRVRRQRPLASRSEYSEQDHRHGVLDGGRD